MDRWAPGAREPVLSPGVVTGCPQLRLLEQENLMTQSGACLNLSITVVAYALRLQTSPRGRADDLGEAEEFPGPYSRGGFFPRKDEHFGEETRAMKWSRMLDLEKYGPE